MVSGAEEAGTNTMRARAERASSGAVTEPVERYRKDGSLPVIDSGESALTRLSPEASCDAYQEMRRRTVDSGGPFFRTKPWKA
jgi:hypothetical protein